MVTSGNNGATVTMESIEMGSIGNAADFGDSGSSASLSAGCGNETKYFMWWSRC